MTGDVFAKFPAGAFAAHAENGVMVKSLRRKGWTARSGSGGLGPILCYASPE